MTDLTPTQKLHDDAVVAIRAAAAKGGFTFAQRNCTAPGNFTIRATKGDVTIEVEMKTSETRAVANASLFTACDLPTYKGTVRERVSLREALRVLRTGEVVS